MTLHPAVVFGAVLLGGAVLGAIGAFVASAGGRDGAGDRLVGAEASSRRGEPAHGGEGRRPTEPSHEAQEVVGRGSEGRRVRADWRPSGSPARALLRSRGDGRGTPPPRAVRSRRDLRHRRLAHDPRAPRGRFGPTRRTPRRSWWARPSCSGSLTSTPTSSRASRSRVACAPAGSWKRPETRSGSSLRWRSRCFLSSSRCWTCWRTRRTAGGDRGRRPVARGLRRPGGTGGRRRLGPFLLVAASCSPSVRGSSGSRSLCTDEGSGVSPLSTLLDRCDQEGEREPHRRRETGDRATMFERLGHHRVRQHRAGSRRPRTLHDRDRC